MVHFAIFKIYKLSTSGVRVIFPISCIFKSSFINIPFEHKFSFEKEYLEKFISEREMAGFIQDHYFIDIGIPEDYERAQHELIVEP